jgi:hypothetical protein
MIFEDVSLTLPDWTATINGVTYNFEVVAVHMSYGELTIEVKGFPRA